MVLAAALSAAVAVASPPSDAAIARESQKLLDRTVRADGPGAALLIARGNEVVIRSARGRAEIELNVPLSPDHAFRIASVTKIFTAASILKLAEAGKLSLDDALAKYLPDIPDAASPTIRQVLNHTAGISDVGKDPQPSPGRRDVDSATRLTAICKRALVFPPGTGWSYSNSGYILLGGVIESITGERWHAVLQKQFLDPLGMTHTRYGDNSVLIPGRAAGYTTESRTQAVRNADLISPAIPDSAGALVSTVDDLRLWMRALGHGRAISRESFQQMITPAPAGASALARDRYGLGVYIWQLQGETMIGHTGQIPGFAAVVNYLPRSDITVVALGNDDTFDARLMGRRLAAIAIGKPYPAAVAVSPSDELLKALAGTYRIDENTVRTVSVKGQRLYTQRGSGNVLPLQVTADKRLHFDPDELSYFVPISDAAGRISRLDYFHDGEGPPQPLPRIQPSPQ
jgi:CubicO group peptidase (beta-lactamase class C family)